MSEMSSIEPDYSSFSDTDTDTDTDVEDEEPADRTMCEEWTHSVPPPLPPRNGVQVSDSSQINDSGSNDSFPKGAPRPILPLPNMISPRSSGSFSYQAQSETEDDDEHLRRIPTISVIEREFSGNFRMIPDSDRDSVQVTRRKQRKSVRGNKETFGHALHSNMTLPGHGIATICIPRTLESNDDYLIPVHALESVLSSGSGDSVPSGSGDSFPSGGAQPFSY